MAKQEKVDNQERKEDTRLDTYKTALKDARHIFNTYKNSHPDEAWECLHKILFNPALK